MRTILVTGGAGFIGSNFVRRIMALDKSVKLVVLDKLTYAGNLANIDDLLKVMPERLAVCEGATFGDSDVIESMFNDFGVKEIVHFAAESHVDRSILSSALFVRTNVIGTQVLLDVAKAKSVERFVACQHR